MAKEPSNITIPEIYHSMRERWGEEWIVDRLLDLAHYTECDWLEFKATMFPPEEKRELYPAGKRGEGLPKHVKGDYILNVVEAIVAFANSGCGGIILLGLAEKKEDKSICPADFEALCFKADDLPFNMDLGSGSVFWNTDGWEQEVHMELGNNSFTDRYQTTWRCSVELNSKIVFGRGVFRRNPILILIVPPEPSPIWLIRETEVGVKKCPLKTIDHKGECHFPHGKPHPEEVIHIMKRVGASVDEWNNPSDLLARWEYRNKVSPGLEERDRDVFQKFSGNNISFLSSFSAMRQWSFCAVTNFLLERGEKQITHGGRVPDYAHQGSCCFYGRSADDLEMVAALLCRNLLYEHELRKPLPLFLKDRTPGWMQMLKHSTASFFEQQLTEFGKGSFSLDNIKFFGQNGNLKFIVTVPDFCESEQKDLWFRAVRELKDKYFNADILLFCHEPPGFTSDYGMQLIPVEEVKMDLITQDIQGDEK